MEREIIFLDLGLKGYRDTEILQEELVENVIKGISPEYILMVQHYPVITLGKSTREDTVFIEDIKDIMKKGIEIYRSKRGGSATLHEPGQLVVYPILKLEKRDVHKYVRDLEGLIIELLKTYNIRAITREKYTGVWIDDRRKICSIGIAVKKWVTYHGLALNVSNKLEDFKLFHPCGLEDVEMVSMESILKRKIDIDELKNRLLHIFSIIFGRRVRFG